MNFLYRLTILVLSILGAGAIFAQPVNDNCNNSIVLTDLTNWCSDTEQFSTINSTLSPQANPSCFPDSDNDVWFAFQAQANTVNINIIGNTNSNPGGTLENPELALYSGSCTTGLTLLECISDAFNNNIVETFGGPLTIGQTYYIRVDGRNGNVGTFQLCINNFNQIPEPTSDCVDGVLLCDKSPFTVQSVQGAGNNVNEIDNTSCIQSEISSVWYKWTCDDPGSLTFTLSPNQESDDLDFAVFELPGGIDDCNNKIMLRCMASGENVGEPFENWEPCTGDTGMSLNDPDLEELPGCQSGNNNYVSSINMESGKSYALIVNNFSNTGSGFSITWGGTGTFLGPLADFSVNPEEGVECEEDLVVIDASIYEAGNIIGWDWNFGSGAVPPTASTAGPHNIVYNSVGTKFVVLTVETDAGCIVTKVIEIEIQPCCPQNHDLEINLTDVEDPNCADTPSGSISAAANGGFPLYEYSLDGINFISLSNFNSLTEGDYTIWVRDIKGCRDSTDASLFDPPPLIVDAGEDVTINLGENTNLDAIVSPITALVDYSWMPDTFLTCYICPDPTAEPTNTTTFTVSVIDQEGCTASDDVTVFIVKNRPIYIPNTFTPNGDGTNDSFTLFGGKSARKIQLLRIFNRWGALVFEGNDMDLGDLSQGWDGTFKGEILQPDVFAFYALIEFIDDEVILFEGDLTILK